MSLEYLLEDGQRAWPSTSMFRGTADWQQQELKAHIPPEADPASVAVSIHRYGSATRRTAWFDDLSLMAITEGVRGLFHWSFGARALMWVKDPQQREEYWRRLAKLTRELHSLRPALVAADTNESVTSVSDPRIRWLARVADGKCYVLAYLPVERLVADPSAAERTEVRFRLAVGQTITRTFRPDFADWFAVLHASSPRR